MIVCLISVFFYSITATPNSDLPLSSNPFGINDFDSLNVSFIGNWPYGPSFTVSYDEVRQHIFLGSGCGVFILNAVDPSQPIRVSEAVRARDLIFEIVLVQRESDKTGVGFKVEN